MNTEELISLFRTEVADIEQPYLWTHDEVLTYLNDAYRMFVRFIGGVPDSSSPATKVAFVAGNSVVTLDPSILRVTRAFRVGDGVELAVIDHTDVPLVREGGQLRLLRVGSSAGAPNYLVMGADPGKADLYPTPTTSGTLLLQVRRLPVAELLQPTDSPVDIGEEHHIHLLKWMKAAAYRKHDVETHDPVMAAEHEAAFLQYCDQSVFEYERLRRKSRLGLRSSRDAKNPMLSATSARNFTGVSGQAGRQQQPRQPQE